MRGKLNEKVGVTIASFAKWRTGNSIKAIRTKNRYTGFYEVSKIVKEAKISGVTRKDWKRERRENWKRKLPALLSNQEFSRQY